MRIAFHLQALLFILLSGCTLFKKTIVKPVVIAYNPSQIIATINSSAVNLKYVYLISEQELSNAFLENFKSEAASTKNVTLSENENGADYILKLRALNISESSKTERINDTKSPYNGMEMLLNSVSCEAQFEIYAVKAGNKRLMNCFNSKSRSEKLSNRRDVGDLILGSNKDRTEYKTRLLSDRIAINLAQDVGRRIWVPITRRIAKHMR